MRKFIKEFRATLEEKAQKDEGNAFTKALNAAREKGDDTFVVAGKKFKVEDYMDKEDDKSDDEKEKMKKKNGDKNGDKDDDDKKQMIDDDASNDKSDDGEGLDKVNPKSAKKKFDDRKDKDIDNDGDVDSSDKFLHKRRKAIGKAMKKDEPKGDKDEVEVNPKKESTIRDRLLSIWEDAAGEKRKKDQNKDEGGDANSGSAKKMKDGHGKPVQGGDNPEDIADDAEKAGKVTTQAPARNNDSKIGDKNIINKVKEAYASMYKITGE